MIIETQPNQDKLESLNLPVEYYFDSVIPLSSQFSRQTRDRRYLINVGHREESLEDLYILSGKDSEVYQNVKKRGSKPQYSELSSYLNEQPVPAHDIDVDELIWLYVTGFGSSGNLNSQLLHKYYPNYFRFPSTGLNIACIDRHEIFEEDISNTMKSVGPNVYLKRIINTYLGKASETMFHNKISKNGIINATKKLNCIYLRNVEMPTHKMHLPFDKEKVNNLLARQVRKPCNVMHITLEKKMIAQRRFRLDIPRL